MKLAIRPVRVRLRTPFVAAWGTVCQRDLLLVALEDRFGQAGFGEAAPLAGYGGASIERTGAALARYEEALAPLANARHEEILAACAAVSELPEALAAVDLGLWDLAGRRAGQPVWGLLGQRPWDIPRNMSERYPTRASMDAVTVNATISAEDPDAVSVAVAGARASGFGCVKVKVAVGDDLARVAAARAAAGDGVAIRLDANGGWSPEQAIIALEALAPFGIELCEEPVHGLEAIERVASAVSVPVALDESAALDGALHHRLCDAVCLKVGRSGGITRLLERARDARAAGYRIYFASTLDGPLGIAAALHAAAAVRPELPCGLATLGLFSDRTELIPVSDGCMRPPPGDGLGGGLVDWYR